MLYSNHIVQLGNMEMCVSGNKLPNVAGRASLVMLSGFFWFFIFPFPFCFCRLSFWCIYYLRMYIGCKHPINSVSNVGRYYMYI